MPKDVFGIKKVKIAITWTYVIEDDNGRKLLERFTKNNCRRQIKQNLELKNYVSNGNATIILLSVGLIKKIWLYKMSYFSEPHTRSNNRIKVELDLANYATKSDLKIAAGLNTLKIVKETDLASLKADIDDLDIDKLKTVPVNLYKLSNVAENDAIKKTVYDEVVKKVNAIQTTLRYLINGGMLINFSIFFRHLPPPPGAEFFVYVIFFFQFRIT